MQSAQASEANEGQLLEGYLSPVQLAGQLGISVRTLSRWHIQRIGPKRCTVGKLILYRIDAVRAWLESREAECPQPSGIRHAEMGR